MVDLTISYVYYDSFEPIQKSIKSILNSKIEFSYTIVIVVNKGNRINLDKISLLSNRIVIIYNSVNLGYGSANNVAALNYNSKYVLILNPDTIVEPNTLQTMFDIMESDKNIGLSICKLVDKNNCVQEPLIYKKYSICMLLMKYFFIDKVLPPSLFFKKYFYTTDELNLPQNPVAISGAFMFFRKSIYNRLKGFDENIFMYTEDLDLSLRVNDISKIYYYPYVKVIHIGGSTLGKEPTYQKLYMMYSSIFYHVVKRFGNTRFYVFKSILVINSLIFYSISFIIRGKNHKKLLRLRSKIFLKLIFNKI